MAESKHSRLTIATGASGGIGRASAPIIPGPGAAVAPAAHPTGTFVAAGPGPVPE